MTDAIQQRKVWTGDRQFANTPGFANAPAATAMPEGIETNSPVGRRNAIAEGVLFWLFLAALAWLPFWQGSNDLRAWGVNAMLFPLLAIAYEWFLLSGGRPHPVALRKIAVPAALFLAVVLWIAVQVATSTPRIVHSPLWTMAQDALAAAIAGSVSVDRDLTVQALVRLLTSASVFWLALQFSRDAERANRLIVGIAVICVAYCVYGLFSFAIAPGNFLSAEQRRAAGFVSSTFYNRNNFATYAGLGAIVTLGLLLRLYRRSAVTVGPARLRIAQFIDTTGRGGALHLCGLVIVVVALLLSGSRGGIISALFGGFVLLALTLAHGRKPAGRYEIVVLAAVVVMVVFIGFGDTFLGKIAQQGLGDESRMAIYRLTAGSIVEQPVLGYGYGTFADVFPIFRDRSVDTSGVWLMAHNTYLEVFQGLGVLFGAMLVVSVALLMLRCILGARRRKLQATFPYIAGSVGCLVAANALVDFSLQIQAVTLTFVAVLGAGIAQSESSQLIVHD